MFAVTIGREIFAQLTANGLFRGCSYGLLGAGFALILGVTGRFHFAYGFTYTLAAYLAFNFHARGTWAGPFHNGVPFIVAAILGILCAALVGTGIERFVYRPIATRAGATALLAIFVAALGATIATELGDREPFLQLRLVGGAHPVDVRLHVRIGRQPRLLSSNAPPQSGSAASSPAGIGASSTWPSARARCRITPGSDMTVKVIGRMGRRFAAAQNQQETKGE